MESSKPQPLTDADLMPPPLPVQGRANAFPANASPTTANASPAKAMRPIVSQSAGPKEMLSRSPKPQPDGDTGLKRGSPAAAAIHVDAKRCRLPFDTKESDVETDGQTSNDNTSTPTTRPWLYPLIETKPQLSFQTWRDPGQGESQPSVDDGRNTSRDGELQIDVEGGDEGDEMGVEVGVECYSNIFDNFFGKLNKIKAGVNEIKSSSDKMILSGSQLSLLSENTYRLNQKLTNDALKLNDILGGIGEDLMRNSTPRKHPAKKQK